MSDHGSFSDLASIKGNTVEKPKNLPDSAYVAQITGPFKERKAKTGNFALQFPIRLIEAHEPSDDVAVALQDPTAAKALARDYAIDFWMSPDARWRFTEFAKAMGISDDLSIIEMAEELVSAGTPFLVQGKNEADSNDPTRVFFRIDNPAPLS